MKTRADHSDSPRTDYNCRLTSSGFRRSPFSRRNRHARYDDPARIRTLSVRLDSIKSQAAAYTTRQPGAPL